MDIEFKIKENARLDSFLKLVQFVTLYELLIWLQGYVPNFLLKEWVYAIVFIMALEFILYTLDKAYGKKGILIASLVIILLALISILMNIVVTINI